MDVSGTGKRDGGQEWTWLRYQEEGLITTWSLVTHKDSVRKTISKLNMYLIIFTIRILTLQFTGQIFVLVGH